MHKQTVVTTFVGVLVIGLTVVLTHKRLADSNSSSASQSNIVPTPTHKSRPCATLRCNAKRLVIRIGTDLYDPPDYYSQKDSSGQQSVPMTKMGKITAEHFNAGWVDMNWKTVEPSPGRFDFSYPDAQVKWAEEHGIEPWAHSLIYSLDELTPDWLIKERNPRKMRKHFQRRITTLMTRYRGRIKHWMVLNEAYEIESERQRGDPWRKLLGDYASSLFKLARETDPSAILIYNEAMNENSTGHYSINRRSTDQIVKELTSRNLLDMLCFQTHIDSTQELNVADFVSYMKSQKVPVCISELDLNLHNYPGTKEQRYQYQAQKVAEIVKAAMDVPIKALFFWDVGDANSWYVTGPYKVGDDADPTLWDRDFNPKPVFYAVMDVLKQKAPVSR